MFARKDIPSSRHFHTEHAAMKWGESRMNCFYTKQLVTYGKLMPLCTVPLTTMHVFGSLPIWHPDLLFYFCLCILSLFIHPTIYNSELRSSFVQQKKLNLSTCLQVELVMKRTIKSNFSHIIIFWLFFYHCDIGIFSCCSCSHALFFTLFTLFYFGKYTVKKNKQLFKLKHHPSHPWNCSSENVI